MIGDKFLAGYVLPFVLVGCASVRERSFSFKEINEDRTGVVVVDMQTHFVSAVRRKELECEMRYQEKILARANKLGLPIYFLEYDNFGETIGSLRDAGGENARVFVKNTENGFINRDFDSAVRTSGLNNLILMGVSSTRCVRRTAEGALSRGINVITSRDLVMDWYSGEKDAGIEWFERNCDYRPSYNEVIPLR